MQRISAELRGDQGWPWIRRNVPDERLQVELRAGDMTEHGVFARLIELYVDGRCGGQALVAGEKTPEHLSDVPTLDAWFPGARFIHTFRDPRAIYTSQLRRVREGRWGLKARMRRVPAALVDPVLAPIEALLTTAAWLRAARLHRRYQRRLGERYLLVRYEDLVADPERELRRVCDFVGVSFDPSMIAEIDVVGSSFSAARHEGSGFDEQRATRWRQEVSALGLGWFRLATGRELRRFGYPPK
jgi:omega-hydroxy-beta-dihydromenaquinone-9 sulfotransferase